MTDRWAEIEASRHPRESEPTVAKDVRRALQRLTSSADWEVFLAWQRKRIDGETIDRSAPNVSALLLIEGRRTFIRELETLADKLSDERPAEPRT